MPTTHRSIAVKLARSALGIPYVWAGNIPAQGLDCSGFACWVLHTLGAIGAGDFTAQGLFDLLNPHLEQLPLNPREGDLAFYGERPSRITHVMLCVGSGEVIGASGGDHTCKDFIRAQALGAYVKRQGLNYRSDLVAIMPVNYADES